MVKEHSYNIRLGIFVSAGVLLLIIALFLVGRNQHLFGSHYQLRTHFTNVGGLRSGNNVRYAGIEVGTVKMIQIINDTSVEVTMLIRKEMKNVIRKNAIASLGSDGLMGNKVVNIVPAVEQGDLAVEGDLLVSVPPVEYDDIIRSLSGTGEDIQRITRTLHRTLSRIDASNGLWKTLSDTGLAIDLRSTARKLMHAADYAEGMMGDVRSLTSAVRSGKGTLGLLLKDTGMANSMVRTMQHLEMVAGDAHTLAENIDALAHDVRDEVREGNGSLGTILHDTTMAGNLRRSLEHVEKGTETFRENMQALQGNFLFRGYFRKKKKSL